MFGGLASHTRDDEVTAPLLAGIAGCLLGAAYVGYLWGDVKRFVVKGRRSLRWGTLFRQAGVVLGCFIVARTGGLNLVALLAGLFATRTLLVWWLGRPGHA